jgi:dTMP kinase
MPGMLITFEGVEGSGKSTQCRLLVESLRARGLDVTLTREPDGTAMGTALRRLFEAPGPPPVALAQVFLFMAARRQHVAEVIGPGLSRGALVVSDRHADATLAYQGFGQGVDIETIRGLNALATGGLVPDLTLVLDLPPDVGMARIRDRSLDAFEKMDPAFHRRVRDGYIEIARTDRQRVVVLDGDQPIDALAAQIKTVVEERLARGERVHVG